MTEPRPEYNAGEALRFWAEIIRVQTMADGAIRMIFEAAENETVLLAQLAECRRRGAILEIEARPKAPDSKPNLYGL